MNDCLAMVRRAVITLAIESGTYDKLSVLGTDALRYILSFVHLSDLLIVVIEKTHANVLAKMINELERSFKIKFQTLNLLMFNDKNVLDSRRIHLKRDEYLFLTYFEVIFETASNERLEKEIEKWRCHGRREVFYIIMRNCSSLHYQVFMDEMNETISKGVPFQEDASLRKKRAQEFSNDLITLVKKCANNDS